MSVDDPRDLRLLLEQQRAAFAAADVPDAAHRRDRLLRLDRALLNWATRLQDAISADYGNRCPAETVLAELVPLRDAIGFARRRVPHWMRPRRRRVGPSFQPGQAWVEPRPIGCVGIVAPWNYPLFLSIGPLVDAIAAGNRAMIKPSELTPRFSALLGEMLAGCFAPSEVAVVSGGPELAQRFCTLPFDHLLFTGSTGIGRTVMRAAAETLTPVTLELGGKSPALIAADADVARAARRLMVGKLFNAGQTCIAPDYVLAPEARLAEVTQALLAEAGRLYPTLAGNPDYSTIISDRHLDRLDRLVAEAAAAGTAVLRDPRHQMEPDAIRHSRRFPPTLLMQPPLHCGIMQEEIFGPLLPVLSYRTLDDAIAFINARPRPLALYCFTDDRDTERRVLDRTLSGGVAVNTTLLQCAQPDLPFGGIGPSGMGAYHGEAGFLRFSHLRGVYRSGRISGFTVLAPPHGALSRRLLPLMLGGKRRAR